MGGRGSEGMVPAMPPGLQHWHIVCPTRHRTDTLRRLIHALNAQRVLVFMNWQSRLQVWCEGGSCGLEQCGAWAIATRPGVHELAVPPAGVVQGW